MLNMVCDVWFSDGLHSIILAFYEAPIKVRTLVILLIDRCKPGTFSKCHLCDCVPC